MGVSGLTLLSKVSGVSSFMANIVPFRVPRTGCEAVHKQCGVDRSLSPPPRTVCNGGQVPSPLCLDFFDSEVHICPGLEVCLFQSLSLVPNGNGERWLQLTVRSCSGVSNCRGENKQHDRKQVH